MKLYNIMCDCYDEAYHDHLYRYVSGPYLTRESAQKAMRENGSSMGSSYEYYIDEIEPK